MEKFKALLRGLSCVGAGSLKGRLWVRLGMGLQNGGEGTWGWLKTNTPFLRVAQSLPQWD